MTQKLKSLALKITPLLALCIFGLATPSALADPGVSCAPGYAHPAGNNSVCKPILSASDCGSGKVSAGDPTKCAPLGGGCAGQTEKTCLSNNKFITDIRDIVNVVSGLVGVVVVGMVILGGIQYSLARDNSGEIGAAQKRIANALIALVLYLLIFGFLQWLIPGGLFA